MSLLSNNPQKEIEMTTSAVAKVSKKNQFIAILATMDRSIGRKALIANLSSAIGISEACASTYLSNVNSGKWTADKTVTVTPAEVKPTIEVVATVAEVEPGVVSTSRSPAIEQEIANATFDVMKMKGPELVALYNKFSDQPVTRFRTVDDGVKRVLRLLGDNLPAALLS
jgi:hypothetical protein